MHDVDDDYATIMEADENLARSEIQGAERTLSVRLREAAWKRIREREGRSIVQSLDDGNIGYKKPPVPQKQFATETASASGMSRSAIYQELKRADEIGEDNLKKIIGTPLSKGVEMDALIQLEPDQRADLITRAEAGEKVSARPELRNYAIACLVCTNVADHCFSKFDFNYILEELASCHSKRRQHRS